MKSSDEAVILCKTAIGALKLNIGDLQVTKVRSRNIYHCFKLGGSPNFLFNCLFLNNFKLQESCKSSAKNSAVHLAQIPIVNISPHRPVSLCSLGGFFQNHSRISC